MKKIIVLFALLGCLIDVQSQCHLPYKSLFELDRDTTGFIMYNLRERGDCYAGRPFSDFLHDLGIPVDNFSLLLNQMNPDEVRGININIYTEKVVKKRIEQKKEPHSIKVFFREPISRKEIKSVSKKKGETWKWSNKVEKFLKSKLIYGTRTNVYSYSEYFERYSEK